MEPRGSPKDFTRGALEDRKRLAGDSLAVDAFERECLAHLAWIIHEGFVKNPGLPDEQPFPPAGGGYVVVGGPGTHPGGRVPDPPGWVRCHRAPATPDPFRTAAPKGSY